MFILIVHVGVARKVLRNYCAFRKSGFTFAFGRNKKGKILGILSQLKKLSKSDDVHAQNIFSSMYLATIAAENLRYTRWRHYIYS
jgi:hypothetical protein